MFFHTKASTRQHKYKVGRLARPDGSYCVDQAEMVTSVSENLYSAEVTIGIEEVLSHVPCKVTPEMNNKLNSPFQEEEVKLTLFLMFPTKASWPDGLLTHFSRRVGNYVMRRLEGSFCESSMEKSLRKN